MLFYKEIFQSQNYIAYQHCIFPDKQEYVYIEILLLCSILYFSISIYFHQQIELSREGPYVDNHLLMVPLLFKV